KRFLHIAIRKYDFVEKRAGKAHKRKPEKRASRSQKSARAEARKVHEQKSEKRASRNPKTTRAEIRKARGPKKEKP
ncbi:MAG: hypothetical protein ACLTZZ_08805, partial [Clostridia bacterium]